MFWLQFSVCTFTFSLPLRKTRSRPSGIAGILISEFSAHRSELITSLRLPLLMVLLLLLLLVQYRVNVRSRSLGRGCARIESKGFGERRIR